MNADDASKFRENFYKVLGRTVYICERMWNNIKDQHNIKAHSINVLIEIAQHTEVTVEQREIIQVHSNIIRDADKNIEMWTCDLKMYTNDLKAFQSICEHKSITDDHCDHCLIRMGRTE
jgi:hypothetical protein